MNAASAPRNDRCGVEGAQLQARHGVAATSTPIEASPRTRIAETMRRGTTAPLMPRRYSTVTDFARFRGWSTSQPRRIATW